MKKQLYSLMLNDDIVREVDRLAHLNGTNRSNYVNRILAEYVNMTTPERRVNDIFEAVGRLLEPMPELVPFFNPNASTFSLKARLFTNTARRCGMRWSSTVGTAPRWARFRSYSALSRKRLSRI